MLSKLMADKTIVINYDIPLDQTVIHLYNQWLNASVHFLIKSLEKLAIKNPLIASKVSQVKLIDHKVLKILVRDPSLQSWMNSLNHSFLYGSIKDMDENEIPLDLSVIDVILQKSEGKDPRKSVSLGIQLNKDDYWLRAFFGKSILFEDDVITEQALSIVNKAFEIIGSYNENLLNEIYLLSPSVQFIQDPSAHPEKIVSFSDNLIPGCLYVSVRTSNDYLNPYDLADSIVHEHRHQKLYLFEYFNPVTSKDNPKVPSPWREELRPVSGLFHAVYVFQNLLDYWMYVYKNSHETLLKGKALSNVKNCQERLSKAHQTLSGCNLTDYGQILLDNFKHSLHNVQQLN